MLEVTQDLRFVIRSFLRKPSFFALAVLILALGIGANTAIFSIVQSVLLQPLPYPDEDRLVWMWGSNQQNPRASISPLDFADYWEAQQSFESFAAFVGSNRVIGTDQGSQKISGAMVSRDFFSVLGIPAELGRTLQAFDFQESATPAIVLSRGFFEDSFGGNPDLLGQSLKVGEDSYTVVGVMPESFGLLPPTFQLPGRGRFWIPFDLSIPEFKVRRFHFLSGLGKLRPGVTLDQARADLDGIARRLEAAYPDTNTGWGLSLIPLTNELTGNVRDSLWILLGAVLMVLLIACSNVANLLLIRANSRRGEMAVRSALGASRWRILRLLLAEGLCMSLLSGVLGILLAQWILALLLYVGPTGIPRLEESGLNLQVFLFSAGLSLLTALAFALVPAGRAFSLNLGQHLQTRGAAASGGRSRFRSGLVVAEIAIAMVLLMGTGLFLKSYLRLSRVDPGFSPDSVTTARISLSASRFQDPATIHSFLGELMQDTRAIPGVREAGIIDRVPMLHPGNDTVFVKEGESLENREDRKGAYVRAANGDYFRAMGIPLLQGRLFDERDQASGNRSVIVSSTFANEVWEGENPVGQYIALDLGEPVRFQVVGVVGSVRQSRLAAPPWRTMYLSIDQRQELLDEFSLVIKNGTGNLAQSLRAVLDRYDPDIALSDVQSLLGVVVGTSAQNRFNLLLMLCFAGLALLLAGIGIYGVISHVVQERTQEIGVRIALGAGVEEVIRLILEQGARLILLGGLLGLVAGFWLVQGLSGLLYQVEIDDPTVFLGGLFVLCVTALAANYLPAWRASRIDPVTALRAE